MIQYSDGMIVESVDIAPSTPNNSRHFIQRFRYAPYMLVQQWFGMGLIFDDEYMSPYEDLPTFKYFMTALSCYVSEGYYTIIRDKSMNGTYFGYENQNRFVWLAIGQK